MYRALVRPSILFRWPPAIAWLLLLVVAVARPALITPRAAADERWPQFRGPAGDGHADGQGFPIHWSETENVVWKTPIHDKGWSSPVVWGNQVWMTTARADGKEMFAVCVDLNSGKILHDHKLLDVAKPAFCPGMNSYASPTPVIEAGRVYIHFGSYGTFCLDTSTGKPLWSRRDLACDHWRAPGSSPILHENLFIAIYDGYDFQYVVALDKTTGKTVWKKDRDIDYGTDNGDLKKAFCTPSVVEADGRQQLICPSAVATIAHDVQTGEELWKVYHGGMNVSARPLFYEGMAIVSTGSGGRFNLFAVRTDGRGDVTKQRVVWTVSKGVPNRPSLVRVDDLLFMANDNGVASCMEARTGRLVWQERLGGDFSASPIYAGGRLYFFDHNGAAHVLRPGRQFNEIAVNHLDAGCMASPAAVGKALIVRTKTHLYRIEDQSPPK